MEAIMKTLFLVMFVVVLYGCADPAVVRRNEMAEARQMVEAQYGGRITEAQKAYLAMQLYATIDQQRQARETAQGQIIANGFQAAGAQVAAGGQAPAQPYYTPYVPQFPQASITPIPGQIVPQRPALIPTGY